MYMFQKLTNSKVLSQLDFNSGYYQIQLSEDSIPLTGFTICNQHYELVNMPFGLANAPRIFHQIMLTIPGDLMFVKAFIDDVFIHSENAQLHTQRLESVL
ncbi:Polyprotein P3 [Dictyocoela muelleri]|nr:Polyprotein P3 [Dictyocoela muelleri]